VHGSRFSPRFAGIPGGELCEFSLEVDLVGEGGFADACLREVDSDKVVEPECA
jgi:hypothetical protein